MSNNDFRKFVSTTTKKKRKTKMICVEKIELKNLKMFSFMSKKNEVKSLCKYREIEC